MAEHREAQHHETSAWLKAAHSAQAESLGTPPGDLYFIYETPNGDRFVNGAALAESFLRLGFKVTGELTLSDSDAWREAVSPGSLEGPVSGAHLSEATATPGAMPQAAPKT